MKKTVRFMSFILLIVLITNTMCACTSKTISGTYSSTNAELGRVITIELNKDGTLIWEESYNIFGDTSMRFYGTYSFNSETNEYSFDVKAGSNVLAKDTVFTVTVISKKELLINGGTVENETFKKQ